jgi:glycosyl transferase family 25
MQFDRSFVINLPHRTDRRKEMMTQLKKAGMSAEFFPAFRFETKEPFFKLGWRGCYMSHLAVLKLARGSKNVVVMEDDLNFVRDYASRITALELPNNWDIFYCSYNNIELNNSVQTFRPVSSGEQFIGAHFYALNGTTIQRLIDTLETYLTRPLGHPLGGPMPLDGALNVFRQQNPDLFVYAALPGLGYQRSSQSDIANSWSGLKWIAPLRKVKNLCRRI